MKLRIALSLVGLLLAVPGTSPAQNLFVANNGNNSIDEINSSGTITVFANSGILNGEYAKLSQPRFARAIHR